MTDIETAIKNIYTRYPMVRNWGIDVVDMRGSSGNRGKAEFFHPNDPGHADKPSPYFRGNPTIEIYDGSVSGRLLENLIFGDMLHWAPVVSPEFSRLRDEVIGSRTEAQKQIDRKAFERAVDNFNESRKYDDWERHNRWDAYLRGYLAPDKNNEWEGSYTPAQEAMLKKIQRLLMGGNATRAPGLLDVQQAGPSASRSRGLLGAPIN